MSRPTKLRSPESRRTRDRVALRCRRLALNLLEDRSLPSFVAPVNFAAGHSPQVTATGHFNTDTIQDLVVANYGGTVSVLVGNGDGTFQAPIDSDTGDNPSSIAVGDFNGDGKMDAATANFGNVTVSVLIGNGDGTFQAPVDIYLGYQPTSVAVGDFNADGMMDLGAVSNFYVPGSWGYWGFYPGWWEGQSHVMMGTGAGSFGAPMTNWLSYGYRSGAAADDFNGDGRDDFAVGNFEYGTVDVALASSTGALGGHTSFWVGYNAGAVAAGDLSGDGKADLVSANWYSNNVGVLLGDGFGGFANVVNYAAGGTPVGIVLGDFNAHNGDGNLDIAVSTSSGSGVSVLLGRGNGTFTPSVPSTSDASLVGVATGDFNGDGWLDAAAANSSGNSASVFVNDQVWPPLDAPSLSINDATVTEGNMGTVTANFTVSLSAAYTQPVTVQYATVDGSATAAGGDYVATSGTLTFGVGDVSKPIAITVNGDRIAEWSENFSIRLSAPTNAFISDPSGMVAIQDDEQTVSIVDSMSGNEGNSGTTPFNFAVTLSAPYDAPVSIDFATADLTADDQYWYGPGATAGDDYQAKTGTVTIPAGMTTAPITVQVIGERVGEYDELFWVNLTSSTSAHLGYNQSLGTILNDEPTVSISGPAAVTEGNSGTTTLTFTVTLSASPEVPLTVSYTTADGSATAGSDYTAKSGTVTFGIGQTTQTIPVLVNGDRIGENDEYFYVNLIDPSEAQIASGTAYGSILDNEPRLSINSPAAIKEGNSGTKLLTFTVTLAVAYDQAVTVKYATHDYSATAGSDYIATSGTLTFAAGQTTKTFTVQIKGEKKKESDESFYVLLSDASSNASIWNDSGWGTILNDDGPRGGRR
jgi:hypothetical protein